MTQPPWQREDYVRFFEAFLEGPGRDLSVTRFGYFAVGEPSFLKNLREGERKMQLETIERAVKFVEIYNAKIESKNDKVDIGAGA